MHTYTCTHIHSCRSMSQRVQVRKKLMRYFKYICTINGFSHFLSNFLFFHVLWNELWTFWFSNPAWSNYSGHFPANAAFWTYAILPLKRRTHYFVKTKQKENDAKYVYISSLHINKNNCCSNRHMGKSTRTLPHTKCFNQNMPTTSIIITSTSARTIQSSCGQAPTICCSQCVTLVCGQTW